MSLEPSNKINQLLLSGTPNGLFFSKWLKEKGYSYQLINKYRKSGWLSSLAHGVMYRTGDSLSAYSALHCYNQQLDKDVRIAAHSALELFGFNHYVPMGKPVLIVASSESNIPEWMRSDVFDKTIKPFTTEIFLEPQITLFQEGKLDLLISAPEQAFLECILLAPNQYSYMDLYYIMEQLTTLRPDILQILLETTKNFRVKRLFLYMAEKADHYWFDLLDSSKVPLGTSKLQLVEGGIYIDKYKITIPKELYEYE